MLHYPKIPGSRAAPGGRCVAFEKYDGTNLHWDWDRDFGFHSFGTRRDEFSLDKSGIAAFVQRHEHLAECVAVFGDSLAEGLELLFREHPRYQPVQQLKAFTEFFGPHSFAGLHQADDPKELRLFDLWAEGFGMIGPEDFAADTSDLSSAGVVYRGKLTGKFADDVREGKYSVAEGVVCKGGNGGPDLWMCKIKTSAYQERLKEAFAQR